RAVAAAGGRALLPGCAACRRAGAGGPRVRQAAELLREAPERLAAGYGQALQCLVDTLVDELLQVGVAVQAAPLQSAGAGDHGFAQPVQGLAGVAAGLLLQFRSAGDQVLEGAAALLAGPGEGAQAGQPDLVGGFGDGAGG